jgi:hypothetical protein
MAGYAEFSDIDGVKGADNDIYWVQAAKTMGDLTVKANYLKGDNEAFGKDVDDDGYNFGLYYKGAKASQPGSWGLMAQYWNQGAPTYAAHTSDCNWFVGEGFKGYGVGMTYALAKNIVLDVAYYDTESKKANGGEDQLLYADLYFTF